MHCMRAEGLEALGWFPVTWPRWWPTEAPWGPPLPRKGTRHHKSCLILCNDQIVLSCLWVKRGVKVYSPLCLCFSGGDARFPEGVCAPAPPQLRKQERLCLGTCSRPRSEVRSGARVSICCFPCEETGVTLSSSAVTECVPEGVSASHGISD